jgi:hypothetical protein
MSWLNLKNPFKFAAGIVKGDWNMTKPAAPEAAPAAPMAAPTSGDPAVAAAAEAERMRLAKAKGRQSTILSGLGTSSSGGQNVQIKTLLGG